MQDGELRDDFQPLYSNFMKLVSKVDAVPVALGDIIDGLRLGREDLEHKIDESIRYYSEFWSWFAENKGIYILGNHDAVFSDLRYRYLLPESIDVCNRAFIDGFYCCHGHEFDILCSDLDFLSRIGVSFLNLISKISPVWEDKLAGLEMKLRKIGRFSRQDMVDVKALKFVDNFLNCKGILWGHTHRFSFRFLNSYGKYIINTGTFLDKQNRLVLLDEDGFKFVETKGIFDSIPKLF